MTNGDSCVSPAGAASIVVEVRRCSKADVSRIEAREPAGRRYAESTFRRQEAGLCAYLVAWVGSEPVGSGELEHGVTPELKNLHVLPGHRGRGIGTRLIRAAEREAVSAGRLRIGVAEDNTAAVRLYIGLGYLATGESTTYTYEFVDDDGNRGHATETSTYLERALRAIR